MNWAAFGVVVFVLLNAMTMLFVGLRNPELGVGFLIVTAAVLYSFATAEDDQ